MSNKYYSIKVGGREPQKVEVGYLEKTTGLPKGQTSKAIIQVGKVAIPNYSRVWGILVESKGKMTGEVKFMKWGSEGGSVIEIRYLANSTSLSKLYQDTVLKLKPRDEDANLNLKYGINDFDAIKDVMLIDMLKHHTLNGDNESRDPSAGQFMFVEHNAQKNVDSKTKEIEERNTATGIVILCKNNPASLAVLAELFGLDSKVQNDILVEQLLEKAEKNYKLFNHVLLDAKQKARMLLDKAEQYKLLDEKTIPTEIMLITEKGKEKLFTKIEDDVKDKFKWVAESFIVPEIYDAFKKLESVVAEHEKLLN